MERKWTTHGQTLPAVCFCVMRVLTQTPWHCGMHQAFFVYFNAHLSCRGEQQKGESVLLWATSEAKQNLSKGKPWRQEGGTLLMILLARLLSVCPIYVTSCIYGCWGGTIVMIYKVWDGLSLLPWYYNSYFTLPYFTIPHQIPFAFPFQALRYKE